MGGISDIPLPQLLQTNLLNENCFSTFSIGQGEDTLTSLIEAYVESNPNAMVVVKGGQSLIYVELDTAATKVALSLCKMATFGDVVCIHADCSINWIIAAHAVLKAQLVYCPFDPASPDDLRDLYF